MKATLKFDLPEDNDDYTLATHGAKYFSILWEIDQYMRDVIKYHTDDYSKKEIDMAQKIRDQLSELCDDGGIDIHSEVR